MTQVDEAVKGRIEAEIGRVSRWLETLKREGRPEELESGGDNTPLSEIADATQVVEEREIGTQLQTWLTDRVVNLNRALERVRAGTYGICERCDEPIGVERLQALPEAVLCVACQKTIEAGQPELEPTRFEWLEASARQAEGAEMD